MSIKSRMRRVLGETEAKHMTVVDLGSKVKGTSNVLDALSRLGAWSKDAESYLDVLKQHAKDKSGVGAGYYGLDSLKDELALMQDLVAFLKKHRGNVMLHGGTGGAAMSARDFEAELARR